MHIFRTIGITIYRSQFGKELIHSRLLYVLPHGEYVYEDEVIH